MQRIIKIKILALGLALGQACSTEMLTSTKSQARGLTENGTYELHWHFPCDVSGSDHANEYSFVGDGHNWLGIDTIESLQLNLSGRACEDNTASRNTVFVLDVSGSMSSDGLNDGSCARYEVLKELAAKLYRSESLNLGVVFFSSGASCLKLGNSGVTFASCKSTDLIAAQDFKGIVDGYSEQLKAKACSSGGGTSYTSAFAAAKDLLHDTNDGSSEVYFFSDGAPNSKSSAKSAASEMRTHTFLATIGFGAGAGAFLQASVASKVKGKPAHRQANDISDLSSHFSELLDTNHATGKLEWERYGSNRGQDKDKGVIELDDLIENDGSFVLPTMSFDLSEPLANKEAAGILIKFTIQPGFSKNSEYSIDADLRFE